MVSMSPHTSKEGLTMKSMKHRRDDLRLTESGDSKSEQLFVMPTESLLINGEWLPGELLNVKRPAGF